MATESKPEIKLPSEVKDAGYELTKNAKQVSAFRHFPVVDLNKMTVPFAEKLVKLKFPYLKKKGDSADKNTASKK